MLKLRPPTHRIDSPGIFISLGDCWDQQKLDADLAIRKEKALADKADKAIADYLAASKGKALTPEEEQAIRDAVALDEDEETAVLFNSPVSRYYSGKTRYQPDADDWDSSGKPCKVRDFLVGQPTEFIIKRLNFQDYRDASTIVGPAKALLEMATLGLREIRSPPGGLSWKAGKGEDRVPDHILQSLHDANVGLISEIGNAVIRFNSPIGEEEGKH